MNTWREVKEEKTRNFLSSFIFLSIHLNAHIFLLSVTEYNVPLYMLRIILERQVKERTAEDKVRKEEEEIVSLYIKISMLNSFPVFNNIQTLTFLLIKY